MSSSKKLTRDLKLKITDPYKAKESYKDIQTLIVIEKWKLSRTAEVNLRSETPRKISENLLMFQVCKTNQPYITAKDLQEG